MNVTFITGNHDKANALSKWIGFDIPIKKIALDEIQSVDIHAVSEHKARQAYKILQSPVLVEDVGLAFDALNGLPGAFIKWFIDEAGLEKTARVLDGFDDRTATAICIWTYFDGKEIIQIEGYQKGSIAMHPVGDGGYGWDKLFIPEDGTIARAEMTEQQYEVSYMASKNYPAVRELFRKLQLES